MDGTMVSPTLEFNGKSFEQLVSQVCRVIAILRLG